jgi:hypothetical protein
MEQTKLYIITSTMKKSFVSVTHYGLVEVSKIHKTNPVVTHILGTAVQNWQISIKVKQVKYYKNQPCRNQMRYTSGWLSERSMVLLAMNPSLNVLNETPFFMAQESLWARISSLPRLHDHTATHFEGNETGYGYQMKSTAAWTPLAGHQLYTDNLKVDAEAPRQVNQLTRIVKTFWYTEKWNLVWTVSDYLT